MSGDVQPRKRKDKKRKKDDYGDIPAQSLPTAPPIVTDDLNIHVHKDDGTGGGICAKIVFFLLFTALAVLVGLIITEHRGSTDIDAVDSDSRFSQIFEGWIDASPTGHDDEENHRLAESVEEHDQVDQDDDDHNDGEDDESHEVDDADDHDDDDEPSQEKSQLDDDDDDDDENEDEDQEEEDVTNEDRTIESEEQEQDQEDDDEDSDDVGSNFKEDDEEDEASEQQYDNSENDEDQELQEDDEDESREIADNDDDQIESNDDDNIASNEVSQEAEEKSQEQDNEDGEVKTQTAKKEIEDAKENEEENSRMAVKIGVGVALLVVAHVVLVRKWKTDGGDTIRPEKHEPTPDLSRRNTIVVPPTIQQVEQDIEETIESDYSDEDGEVDSEDELTLAKAKYQELRRTYEKSLTPESDVEYATNKVSEGEDDEQEYEDEEGEEDEEEEEDDDDVVEEEDEESENEDDQLLKRLEAKYGKLKKDAAVAASWKRVNVRPDSEAEESESDRQSDDPDTYDYENITNKDDREIKDKLDEARGTADNNPAKAVKLFDVLLRNHPRSPRSWYGKAQALDHLAEERKSNKFLQSSIESYLKVLTLDNVPDVLFINSAERCINRMRFIGNYNRAIDVHNLLIKRFPSEPKYRNQLAVSYLTVNRIREARNVLEENLSKFPKDGFSLVHYGFILKTSDNNFKDAVEYLKRGLATKDEGVIDGRFFFHLGDALARLGRINEATEVYEEGVELNLFLSKYQRSLYNVNRLKAQPWWCTEETPNSYKKFFKSLEINWKKIRDEGLSVLDKSGHFQDESENLRDTGNWKQFELFARGRKNVENCKKCPITCEIIERFHDSKNCKRGQTKFSVMHPGTHVWPHCGPTNCRLRAHLGLNVPPNTFIRVADEIRSWENGKVLIFDDSFEHEVWHNGTTFRLILIVDVWHPDLNQSEKNNLSPI